ncbi:MAG: type II toxin-antitoxin system YafQ family toxin [Sulfuricurvum sp.]|uniref:type II toxin-antitoxin system YafQ family toxin n=1 Tax=Sulfuricurvum sp. TaxID=2025608 RepID=UPI0026227B7B|nr:type II toxin-antitoxin system YafQ family toxin [Sulfuricurvum sp.]MDD2368610.1 type II toxin-antitoxin system YafQ family toxin [Sulfuricurvum sp.]MDD2950524.1 type II toxin-antitoxin system YafQ family toxin [Sulfuricurvum sp.]MDD5119178.1 type II toxin-antitoxin system YafQ family toxin [Sulfuricurvum sp.]
MKYDIFRTASFKKGFKKLSSKHQEEAFIVIELLANGDALPQKYKDHLLSGNYKGCRECHIRPDLLLIYRINEGILELALIEVGSHSDLFG